MKYYNVGELRNIIEGLSDDTILCVSEDGKVYQTMEPYNLRENK